MTHTVEKLDRTDIVLPMTSINGTDKQVLIDQQLAALAEVRQAIKSLRDAAPNGRDFQTIGGDAFRRAQVQHARRLELLQTVECELVWIAEGITYTS